MRYLFGSLAVLLAVTALASASAPTLADDCFTPAPTPIGETPTVTPESTPCLTDTPTATPTAEPTATPTRTPARTSAPTATPTPTVTPTLAPSSTLAPLPTVTPSPKPSAGSPSPSGPTPSRTARPSATLLVRGGSMEYEIPSAIKPGQTFDMTISLRLPSELTSAGSVLIVPGSGNDLQLKDSSRDFLVYLRPPKATVLTLYVGAGNFAVESTDWTRAIAPGVSQADWRIRLTPNIGATGDQRLVITMTQEIDGEELPAGAGQYEFQNLILTIADSGGGSSFFGGTIFLVLLLVPLLLLLVAALIVSRHSIIDFIQRAFDR